VTPAELSEDLLSAYLDGELDAETRSAVEAQVADVPAWRDLLDDVRAARDAVRALPSVDLSRAAWARVVAVVAADESAPVVTERRGVTARVRQARRGSARWVGVGAAAIAAAVLAVVIVPSPSHVTPKVATFTTEHSARASLAADPVSTLAGATLMRGLGR
jgi:anti-sigma factor RsiW